MITTPTRESHTRVRPFGRKTVRLTRDHLSGHGRSGTRKRLRTHSDFEPYCPLSVITGLERDMVSGIGPSSIKSPIPLRVKRDYILDSN